ncbi:unnamed protein product [Eruca vesicaria subsp. sativa]|uniref:Uncharacterized protein n=1 Tax=Eruca vesicaria subsp. sativa TaxID=29727 RepID=A0ABC8K6B1_ERUVS|nr:unnamed protein product [Eruca vesicaria subsp. sativa]
MSWHFRVKIHRIYPSYSYVTDSGPHWIYILGNEDATSPFLSRFPGNKLSVHTNCDAPYTSPHHRSSEQSALHGLQNIHEIPHMNPKGRNYPIVVFNTEVHFDDPARPKIVFYIRDNIESRKKCVATRDHAYAFQDDLQNMRGRGQVILVMDYGLRPRIYYLISGSIRFCQRFRSSENRSITMTLMFGVTGL